MGVLLLVAACPGQPSATTLGPTSDLTTAVESTTTAGTGVPTTGGPAPDTTTGNTSTGGEVTSTGLATMGLTTTGPMTTGGTTLDTLTTGQESSSSGGAEPFCGDGMVDDGEACDDGNRDDEDHCLNCVLATCGDGHVEAGVEACDDGNQVDDDACTNNCGSQNCGDGVVQDGESCDLGPNNSNTGVCTLACKPAACGDGFVQPGETCDDKDGDDGDECPGNCQMAACGDGFVHAGVEACDDGNLVDTDACTAACAAATCGDGLVHAGVEACDGGGMATPLCDPDCTAAQCGDGFLNAAAGELCDDGNVAPNDGCEPNCKLAVEVSVGLRHTCVRLSDGRARCWGYNSFGQVGNNSQSDIGCAPGNLPMPNLGFGGKLVRDIVAGGSHTCALLTTGELRCWGSSIFLAYVPPLNNPWVPPSQNLDVGAPVKQLALGGALTCVLTDSGGVRCWGLGSEGKLGTGNTNNINKLPVPDIAIGGTAVQISTGRHACALLDGGAVKCWGQNTYGELGVGHTNNIGDQPGEMPPAAVELGGPAVQVAAGERHTCALLANGTVRCWGSSGNGQLGQGHKLSIGDQPGEMPPPPTDIGGKATEIAVGGNFSCALLDTGKVRCWGRHVQLGIGIAGSSLGDDPGEMPPPDAVLGGVAVKLAFAGAYSNHMCALMNDQTLRCWGFAGDCGLGLPLQQTGQYLGDNETPASLISVPY
jgi:cysteine-rich repeat protein